MSEIADQQTLQVYAERARAYADRDRTKRVAGFLQPFMAELPPGGSVLDLGCGAGWAAQIMQARGFDVHALDASPEFAAIAQAKLKRPVRIMSFEQLDDEAVFDGIWASGALLHVRKADLPSVLEIVARALKPGGRLLASFKAGKGEGRDKLGRRFSYYGLDELRELIRGVPNLRWDGYIAATGPDFAQQSNTVYAVKAERPG